MASRLEDENVLDSLAGCRFFTKLVMQEAFLQVPLETKSWELTGFATPGRETFVFNWMPFGIKVAPGIFLMESSEML